MKSPLLRGKTWKEEIIASNRQDAEEQRWQGTHTPRSSPGTLFAVVLPTQTLLILLKSPGWSIARKLWNDLAPPRHSLLNPGAGVNPGVVASANKTTVLLPLALRSP